MYAQIESAAGAAGRAVYGAVLPARTAVHGLDHGSLILLGTGAGFWEIFKSSPEYNDGARDPVDRWSRRVIGGLAAAHSAAAHYPFGGPPYSPFINWAKASGRAFTSPSQLLVHDQMGMMISYRGALHLMREIEMPPPPLAASPCLACTARPCLTACPVNAMVDGGPYGLAACHGHLDTAAGGECLSRGCLARRACPLSAGAGRCSEQTAHHMRYFHHP